MKKIVISILTIALFANCESKKKIASSEVKNTQTENIQTEKFLVIPSKVSGIPENNNFQDNDSEFSIKRMKESPNFAILWAKSIGDDPMLNPDKEKTFDVDSILSEGERFYDYYVNQAKFLTKGNSHSDNSKILVIVRESENKTAYGWGNENVGIFWTPPERIHPIPYGVVAHELAHSFQYLVHQDGHWAFSTKPKGSKSKPIFEMSAQYFLFQVYPDWMTFENYHLKAFLKNSHYAFLHEINSYHSPYVFEYWSSLHGKEFFSKIWREAIEGEDAVMVYKRLIGLNQKEFNDEIFNGYRKFITWDIDRIRDLAAPYINMHKTKFIAAEDNWFKIDPSNTPQNYGYNGIELNLPAEGNQVTVDFKGISGDEAYRNINTDKAGWRYGFVAYKENGERVYSDIYNKNEDTVTFNVPENTANLWLVVSGAPTEHWEHITDGLDETDEQWPYQIKLTNTSLK